MRGIQHPLLALEKEEGTRDEGVQWPPETERLSVCSQQGNWISAPQPQRTESATAWLSFKQISHLFFFKAKTTHPQYKSVWNRHESVSLAWHPKASHWYQLGIFHSQHLLGTSRHISLLLSLVYEVHIVDISLGLEWQIYNVLSKIAEFSFVCRHGILTEAHWGYGSFSLLPTSVRQSLYEKLLDHRC